MAFPGRPDGLGSPSSCFFSERRKRKKSSIQRRQLAEETCAAVDQLVAEYHSQLSRDQAQAVGVIYARYFSRFQHSIVDQVRGCLEAAHRLGIFVPSDQIFFDLAVRGAKARRVGLDSLKNCLQRKAAQVMLVFTTNRLFRKTYKALQFVEEEVVGRGIRGLFVKSGVDTTDEKRWRILYQNHAMTDEFVSSMYADNIRAAQEGLFHKKMVFGTNSFGYRGKEVPGQLTRTKRPRTEFEIDPETAPWVRKIFSWYVERRLNLAEIFRRLNADPTAPEGREPSAVAGHDLPCGFFLPIRFIAAAGTTARWSASDKASRITRASFHASYRWLKGSSRNCR